MAASLNEPDPPRIALTLGDPAGIGPEIALAAVRDPRVYEHMRITLIGPRALCPADVPPVMESDGDAGAAVRWLSSGELAHWRMGEAQAECGAAALDALRVGHRLAIEGRVDALVTGPVCKQALHMAGELVEGQTELLARWAGAGRCQMLAIAGCLRVMLLTRHQPLRDAIASIHTDSVVLHLELLDETLRRLGFSEPRIALAGLNPHAGEGGLLGAEEQEILRPAVERARALGISVRGPEPADSVFLQASQGAHDGVLALYHDQAFIPIKLFGQGLGLTVLAGFPYLRVSPTHGTAFDIAGQGVASPENLVAALVRASRWTAGWAAVPGKVVPGPSGEARGAPSG